MQKSLDSQSFDVRGRRHGRRPQLPAGRRRRRPQRRLRRRRHHRHHRVGRARSSRSAARIFARIRWPSPTPAIWAADRRRPRRPDHERPSVGFRCRRSAEGAESERLPCGPDEGQLGGGLHQVERLGQRRRRGLVQAGVTKPPAACGPTCDSTMSGLGARFSRSPTKVDPKMRAPSRIPSPMRSCTN